MSCSHEATLGHVTLKTYDIKKLAQSFSTQRKARPLPLRKQQLDVSRTINEIPAIDQQLKTRLPWKTDVNYFRKVYISAIALTKMTIHAKSGGSIEIMGMMTGKIIEHGIVVMDVYPLPVEGTETRVNAQAEGYEFMVRYLEANKKLGRDENIVGWYHSHPGYGCWLSGIDVGTQALNQNFQDPYLAIVVDPIKTMKQNKVEIGAFRTYPQEYLDSRGKTTKKTNADNKNVPRSKQKDFGIHCAQYYSLDIEIYCSETDALFFEYMNQCDESNSAAWLNSLLSKEEKEVSGVNSEQTEETKNSYKKSLVDYYEVQDDTMDRVLKLVDLLQSWSYPQLGLKKIDLLFEDVIFKKLLQGPKKRHYRSTLSEDEDEDDGDISECERTRNAKPEDVADFDDESDLDEPDRKARRALDVSDVDDAMSVESSSMYKNDGEESAGSGSINATALEDNEDDDEKAALMDEFQRIYDETSDDERLPSMKRNRLEGRRKEPELMRKQLSRVEKLSREVALSIAALDVKRPGLDKSLRTAGRLARMDSREAVQRVGRPQAPPKFLRHDTDKLGKYSDAVGEAEMRELMTMEMQHKLFL